MNLVAELSDLRRRQLERPLPEVEVDSGPAVPGWVFRGAAPLVVGVLPAVTGLHVGLMPQLALSCAGLLALWTVVRPGPVPAHLAVLLCALTFLGAPDAPFDAAVLGLAPLGYAAVRLTWWAGHVGRRTRVETAAVLRGAGRDLTVMVVTLCVGGVAWLASGVAVGGLVVLGAAVLVALVNVLLARSRP
jgi:hypothetical protein